MLRLSTFKFTYTSNPLSLHVSFVLIIGALWCFELAQEQHHTGQNKDETEWVGDPALLDIAGNELHIRRCG